MAHLRWRADGDPPPPEDARGISPVGTFFIVFFVLLVAAAVGWVAFTQLRAKRLGLPAPSLSSYNPFSRSDTLSYGAPTPRSGGIGGWISDKMRALRGGSGGGGSNSRSAPGAYERRGFGPLDPDEAWDARVGTEADGYGGGPGGAYGYYEEQELDNAPSASNTAYHPYGSGGRGGDNTAYAGSRYDMNLPADDDDDNHERGRTRSRSPAGVRASEGLAAPGGGGRNPFDDDADPSNISVRGVGSRPIDAAAARRVGGPGVAGGSPTSERRSIFREDV